MTKKEPSAGEGVWYPRACLECLRRGHLLAALAPYLEQVCSPLPGLAARELLGLSSPTLAQVAAPGRAAELLGRVEELSKHQLEDLNSEAGCWALCRCEAGFPASLREVPDSPWAIFGRGDPALLRDLAPDDAVALVGARRTTSYGGSVARELGRELAETGLVVISSLGFGVDGLAHRGALESGRTVAVLAGGPDVPCPAGNRPVWRQICDHGAVISEMPPGTGACGWSFPARDRIVATLAASTIVVEAAERSRTLITAEMALQIGRELGAVPGPVTSRSSAGSNRLLVQGARLIRGAEDLPSAAARVRR